MIFRVSFADWLLTDEAKPLIEEYADECSIPGIGRPNPQVEIYAQLEALRTLQSFAAYQGGLVGFANVLIPILPHYGVRVATVETLFVTRKARKSGIGRELMLAVEKYALEAGCKGILYSAPQGGQLERVLSAKKYHQTNSVFFRQLS